MKFFKKILLNQLEKNKSQREVKQFFCKKRTLILVRKSLHYLKLYFEFDTV